MSDKPEGMITIEEFSEVTEVAIEKIIKMIRDGDLVGRMIDGQWYVAIDGIEETQDSLEKNEIGVSTVAGAGIFVLIAHALMLVADFARVAKFSKVAIHTDDIVDITQITSRSTGYTDDMVGFASREDDIVDIAQITNRSTDDIVNSSFREREGFLMGSRSSFDEAYPSILKKKPRKPKENFDELIAKENLDKKLEHLIETISDVLPPSNKLNINEVKNIRNKVSDDSVKKIEIDNFYIYIKLEDEGYRLSVTVDLASVSLKSAGAGITYKVVKSNFSHVVEGEKKHEK